jgi:hypothetical protein
MGFERFNLNSPARQALWQQHRDGIETLLERIKTEAFGGNAAIRRDIVSRFSGLAKPNLTLASTSDLRGFIGICVSPKQEDKLRVLVSNGHTASRHDTIPAKLEKSAEVALSRWLSQPMYKPGGKKRLPGSDVVS